MSHPARLALLAVLLGTTAAAEAGHKKKHVEVEEVADADDEDEASEPVDEPEVVVHRKAAPRKNDWNFAIGPYLWMSAVDANVQVGGQNVASGVDFSSISSHAKFGMQAQTEIRYARFAMTGDLTYGVIGLAGSYPAGPVMASIDGEAQSIMLDTFAGYTVLGDEHSLFALEPRVGLRYASTEVRAGVDVDAMQATTIVYLTSSKDALAGARAWFRPLPWLAFDGALDHGVIGDSSSTWSATIEGSVKLGRHVMVSAGYRTLTTEGSAMSLTMHGPRAAVQVLF